MNPHNPGVAALSATRLVRLRRSLVLLPLVVIYMLMMCLGPNSAGAQTKPPPAPPTTGGSQTKPPPAPAASPGSLSGTVKSDDGKPIVGAEVRILDPQLPSVFTDAKGKYFFPALAGGDHPMSVNFPCKFGQGTTVHIDGNKVENFFLGVQGNNDGGRFLDASYFCRVATFAPIDIANVLPLTGDDQSINVTLPFAFPFYGRLETDVDISTNGVVSFSGPFTAFNNGTLLQNPPVADGIYAFWDDLIVDSQGSVRAATIGAPGNQLFAIEWRNVLIRGTSSRINIEVVLFQDGGIHMLWSDIGAPAVEHGSSATVGLAHNPSNHFLVEVLDDPVIRNDSAIFLREDFAPRASAGPDRKVAPGVAFPLDGTGTNDVDDNNAALKFQWVRRDGLNAVIDNAQTSTPTVRAINGNGKVTFSLTVTDPFGQQSSDDVTITVGQVKPK